MSQNQSKVNWQQIADCANVSPMSLYFPPVEDLMLYFDGADWGDNVKLDVASFLPDQLTPNALSTRGKTHAIVLLPLLAAKTTPTATNPADSAANPATLQRELPIMMPAPRSWPPTCGADALPIAHAAKHATSTAASVLTNAGDSSNSDGPPVWKQCLCHCQQAGHFKGSLVDAFKHKISALVEAHQDSFGVNLPVWVKNLPSTTQVMCAVLLERILHRKEHTQAMNNEKGKKRKKDEENKVRGEDICCQSMQPHRKCAAAAINISDSNSNAENRAPIKKACKLRAGSLAKDILEVKNCFKEMVEVSKANAEAHTRAMESFCCTLEHALCQNVSQGNFGTLRANNQQQHQPVIGVGLGGERWSRQ
ncbi:uncharacterized protein SCHCODRAFT_02603714 [Schizophyllum commune H4-8]|uniref:Uncharacterized protein n=1 Tax=Schizophyllum commune (strain H4-8 / FGSC 9210) TaxID=578458 RepID=D8QKR0_SCHCM|nr:uncharacterized protein SCHCODRAFT_02603714 [Schizophyllum commune H4-8]KAI5885229.1 hypothetical protein SCHCODRAFT_02603714 [Schizophyllum commune H4-8]